MRMRTASLMAAATTVAALLVPVAGWSSGGHGSGHGQAAAPGHGAPAANAAAGQAADAMAEAEVRKVDKSAGKLTLRHGPIANLQMPPMTMVFRVAEASMLEAVQPGDKVRFRAEEIRGSYTVMRIEKQ